MIEKIRNIFAIPELRRKILFTLGILVIVRLGSQVPIPGINPDALRQTMESLNDTFFGLFNLFTGGAFGQAAIFGLGIMPYISVSIVKKHCKMQLFLLMQPQVINCPPPVSLMPLAWVEFLPH